MIQIQLFKPFYTKITSEYLRLVFAYQYFSIIKDDEVFHFIPIEGKEIHVDLETKQITNLSEVFVFQRGNRFIRLPLYQLILVSTIHEKIGEIFDEAVGTATLEAKASKYPVSDEAKTTANEFLTRFTEQQIRTEIDKALDNSDQALFTKLVALLHENELPVVTTANEQAQANWIETSIIPF